MKYQDYESVPIADLRALDGRDVVSLDIHGKQPDVPYMSEFRFFSRHGYQPPRIKISTPTRETFLAEQTEAEAEQALIKLTMSTHDLTAGAIDIHPFHGAVFGTKINPVSPGQNPGIGLLERLHTLITLVPNGGIFSEKLSDETEPLPPAFELTSLAAATWLARAKAAGLANPNQSAKDQADMHGFADRWQTEFDTYNLPEILSRDPMTVTLGSVALLMLTLSDRKIFKSTTAMVHVGQAG